jgi:hypothetical protein
VRGGMLSGGRIPVRAIASVNRRRRGVTAVKSMES